MERKNVVIGMKVVPHRKSTGKPFHMSNAMVSAIDKSQPFLYVAHQHAGERDKSDRFMLSDDEKDVNLCGDYFMCSDFEAYSE